MSLESLTRHFNQGMCELGYIEGQNIVIEYRSEELPTKFELFVNLNREADRPDDSTECVGESGPGHQMTF